jgi:hypothetical protein
MSYKNFFIYESLAERIINRIKNDPELTLQTLQYDLELELADRKKQINDSIEGNKSWSYG